MTNLVKKSLSLALLFSSVIALADSCGYGCAAPYYSIRPQSMNLARELVGAGWNTQINLCDMCKWYANMSITAEFTRSTRSNRICDCLFGCSASDCCYTCTTACNSCYTGCNSNSCCNDDCCYVRVEGSQVTSRNSGAWLADYFGLPTDYKSVITFEPRIKQFLVDFNFYVGLDEWVQGMFFRIHAPFVHTRWDLNMCECISARGVNDADLGYYNSARVTDTAGILRANLTQSAAGFLSGCDGIKNTSDITFNRLCFGKLSACELTENGLADIRMGLGWNFWCDEDYHFGLSIIGAAPTGNQPKGNYLFEPIVGNGRHWELGAGLTGHWTFWRDECEERSCAFYLDANVTHMFKAKQCRTFDLCGKPLSRYMLAAKMKSTIADGLLGGTTGTAVAPNAQFDGRYTSVANLTHQEVDVSVGVQGDIALMFQYLHCNWSFDLGYEFWIRSCEKLSARCNCCPGLTNDTTWVLKGDAYMYGYNSALTDATKTALSASQSEATICAGTNTTVSGYANTRVDNPQYAWRSTATLYTGAAADRVYTSINPVFITNSLIDICGAATRGNSHKIFANFDYTWCEQDCYVPYLGLGGEVEFGCKCCDNCNSCGPCGTTCGTNCCTTSCDTTCNPCNTSCNTSCCSSSCQCCAVSQWGIWVKGGFAFN